MFKSNKFGRIFWVDDELEFKSCPLNVDGTGDFTCEDYISEWCDWEGVDMNELLAIHKTCILNKTQYGGSLSLNDYAHKITDSDDNYGEKVDRLVDNMEMNSYKWDEQFYNEIVKNDKFSYGKFKDPDYPIHLSQS
jgi:hypothetical protein